MNKGNNPFVPSRARSPLIVSGDSGHVAGLLETLMGIVCYAT